MDSKKKTSLWQQVARFAVVGGGAFVIDYSLMIVLTELAGIDYLISSAISFTISVIFNYILSVYWVFNVTTGRSQTQDFLVFIVLSVIGLGINQVIMWLCVDKLGIFYMFSKIGATGVVMVYNFITRKIFLEKNTQE